MNVKTQRIWDARFMELAALVGSWSKDPSTKVGAVIVRPDRTIVSAGYNGFPRGVPDRPEDYANRGVKYPRVVHAEVNAIVTSHGQTTGCTIYTTMMPCPQCAALIIQAGLVRVVAPLVLASDPRFERLGLDTSGDMLAQGGVALNAVRMGGPPA